MNGPNSFNHLPVLLNECINGLNIKPNGIYVDGTLGGGGHSLCIAQKLSKTGVLLGLDRDMAAICAANKALSGYTDIFTPIHGNFANIINILNAREIQSVDGVLLDLGVSSHQLDNTGRGFSYMHDAPLDMRMDTESGITAFDIVNTYEHGRLSNIIFKYGEERWAKRIAAFIVDARKIKPINTTMELVSVIKAAIPKSARAGGPHPAKRTFQAIRIEVNGELEILEKAVTDISSVLNKGGRICIITFHSLEDRIIKNVFSSLENPCLCPRGFPVCVCGKKQCLKVITKKPIVPSSTELSINHRARSAKLRIAEKI